MTQSPDEERAYAMRQRIRMLARRKERAWWKRRRIGWPILPGRQWWNDPELLLPSVDEAVRDFQRIALMHQSTARPRGAFHTALVGAEVTNPRPAPSRDDIIRLSNDLDRCLRSGQKFRFRPGAYGAFDTVQVVNAARLAWSLIERGNPNFLNNPHWLRRCQLERKT